MACPVCRARFRGARVCSRCGADLTPLMLLAARAWRLRQDARLAMTESDYGRALESAAAAQELQRSRSGEFLRLLARWFGE